MIDLNPNIIDVQPHDKLVLRQEANGIHTVKIIRCNAVLDEGQLNGSMNQNPGIAVFENVGPVKRIVSIA